MVHVGDVVVGHATGVDLVGGPGLEGLCHGGVDVVLELLAVFPCDVALAVEVLEAVVRVVDDVVAGGGEVVVGVTTVWRW
jgi:hypothetical protein